MVYFPEKSPQAGTKQGFSLIVAIFLTAFLVVLIVSMTLILQMEKQAGMTALSKLRAREAARLALMMALGDLQRHAGPDQRVTARAEITGASNQNRYWTGVWDTSNESAEAHWLVSGDTPDPSANSPSVQLQAEYDHRSDGTYHTPYDVPAVRAPTTSLESNETEIAWWVADEGVKAAIKPVNDVSQELPTLEGKATPPEYYGYSEKTLRSAAFLNDPVFDFKALYDITESSDSILHELEKINSKSQIAPLVEDFALPLKKKVASQFLHAVTLENYFVLSNSKEGGLKKDLSYLKTIHPHTITAADLNTLYADADSLLTPDFARALYVNANPTAGDKDSMMGMQIPRDTVSAVESAEQDFSILPVITEFQVSAGLAADDQTEAGELYLVHKLYIELWNPYTVPFVLGKDDLAAELGYSDLRFEISNLPNYSITNNSSGETTTGSLPDLSYLLSRDTGDQTMRPGMVFYTTLPRDNGGTGDTGTFHLPLGTALAGKNSDEYSGEFTMSGPVDIRVIAINSTGAEKEIYAFELDGYPDFEIEYESGQRATWFNRRKSSKDGQFGMNNESLERIGYAFGFRFKFLDSQNSETMVADLSNWLSLQDPRRRSFSIDLNHWNINAVWTDPDTPPYDFRLSSNDFDPGFFDPGESFKSDDFFYYQTSGTGRKDRVARVFNIATVEPTNPDLLNAIHYPGERPNPIGNPWGEELNAVYDRYFFSTLPAPSGSDQDLGSKPLLNCRLHVLDENLTLSGVDAAEGLILENGFNLNSTSALAWEKVLSGHRIAAEDARMRYEQGSFANPPEWFRVPKKLNNGFFKFPEAAAFNATEREFGPRYEVLLRKEVGDYDNAFRIDSVQLHTDRQHPAFVQSFRELQKDIPIKLGQAIVEELREFYNEEGHPPFSLAEYISSGLLQDAINATPEVNQRSGDFDEIPAYGPSSIDQRALLNAIGSLASVRSDSFEITARADINDPSTGRVLESAMCRATVQRLAEAHTNPEFGRKFQILQFEWLTPKFD
ncbi:hypothetical protein [Coraliomargarita sinensis]|uniref:hypothetical protein n=1 Tax=Coraliomargarita sinensis TaxID=2174842 RepID=UPI000D72ED48|nr:hypothetical protein [Coraliomargarita sinensis]